MIWDDLAGSEVIARLVQRGTPIDEARALVARRDHHREHTEIERRLDR